MSAPKFEDSELDQLQKPRRNFVEPDDFYRLERKVDKLIEKLAEIAILSVHHNNLEKDFLELKVKVTEMETVAIKLERKVDQWINRGIGVWAVVLAGISIFEFWYRGGK